MKSVRSRWACLPWELRSELAVGTTGKNHLMQLAGKALQPVHRKGRGESRELLSLSQAMLLASWEEDPLDDIVTRQLLRLHSLQPFLSPDLASLAQSIHRSSTSNIPRETGVEVDSDDPERAQSRFYARVKETGGSLSAWHELLRWALGDGRYGWAENLLVDCRWEGPLERIRWRYLADLACLQGGHDRWLERVSRYSVGLSEADGCNIGARAAMICNDREKAASLWTESLISRPWQTHVILHLYDLVCGIDEETVPLEGPVGICLYSHNKVNELQETLAALAASRLPASHRVFVLVNGSRDGTVEMLRSWENRWGRERFEIIQLPVNIGAPAARNWLMHHPRVQGCQWVVYLDDDASVPVDWVGRLGAAVRHYPDAGVWGCRVVDGETPSVLQSVDYHLLEPPSDEATHEPKVPYALSLLHHESLDRGQFTYLRPCVHVTGCCHLFKRETLIQSGDFDLRFSPSQFDDLEHDFRLGLARKPSVYQGYLKVAHKNRSGKAAALQGRHRGSARANLYKLYHKYQPEEFQKLRCWALSWVVDDLQRKLHDLEI